MGVAEAYFEKYPELAILKTFRMIIVWGLPMGYNTHSYIHGTWVKALTALGLDVRWYHTDTWHTPLTIPADIDYSNCCFITEGWADRGIPIVPSSTYFVHIAHDPAKYMSVGARLIDMRYNVEYVNDFTYTYKLPQDAHYLSPETLYKVLPNDADVAVKRGREINNTTYEAIYMYWATDLLPHEFNYDDAAAPHENTIYHLGVLDDGHPLHKMGEVAEAHGVTFKHINTWVTPQYFEDNIRIMKSSYCCPDFRNFYGIDSQRSGYIPCRVFKAISYGHTGITNSPRVKEVLGDHVEYVSSIEEIIPTVKKRENDVEWRQAAMRHVAERHTYINRICDLARALGMPRPAPVQS